MWTDKIQRHVGSPLTPNPLTAHPSHFLPPTHTQHSLPCQHKHGETGNWALVARSLILWYFLGDNSFTANTCEAQRGFGQHKEIKIPVFCWNNLIIRDFSAKVHFSLGRVNIEN